MPKTSNKRVRQESQSMDQRPVKKARIISASADSGATMDRDPSIALQLPPELMFEIFSYFQSLPIPFKDPGRGSYDQILSKEYLEQTDILRAISQTCQVWRQMYLPMLWQRLDVVSSHSNSGAWYKTLGESLIRKSRLVHEMPELASHVRSVSVCLSRYSMRRVLPALVSMIEHLPNLETLQIIRTHSHMTTPLKGAFEGHIFPQIQALYLPSYAHHILRSCPNVVRVGCNSLDDGSKLVSAIRKDCKYVEEVEGFAAHENIVKRLARAAPRIKTIKLKMQYYCNHHGVAPLSLKKFEHLQSVVFMNTQLTEEHHQYILNTYKPLIQVAKDALKASKSAFDKKSFKFEGKGWTKALDLGIVTA